MFRSLVCFFLTIEWNADNLVSNEIFTLPKVMNAIYRKSVSQSYWKLTLDVHTYVCTTMYVRMYDCRSVCVWLKV